MDFFAHLFCYRILYRRRAVGAVLDELKQKYPKLGIQYVPADWEVLYNIIRRRDLEMSYQADRQEANSIMLRNFSLGFFVYAIFQVVILIGAFTWQSLLLAIGSLIFCAVAFQQSRMFHRWFFTAVFMASLDYGKSLKDVLAADEKLAALQSKTEIKT